MTIADVTKENECCCTCTHNKRTFDKDYHCTCACELDGHRIGYVANFESVCEEWEGRQGMTDILIAFIFEVFTGACLLVTVSCIVVRGENNEDMLN